MTSAINFWIKTGWAPLLEKIRKQPMSVQERLDVLWAIIQDAEIECQAIREMIGEDDGKQDRVD